MVNVAGIAESTSAADIAPRQAETARGGGTWTAALFGGEQMPAKVPGTPVGLPTIPVEYVAPPALLAQAEPGNAPVPAFPDAFVDGRSIRDPETTKQRPDKVRHAVIESINGPKQGNLPDLGYVDPTLRSDELTQRYEGKPLARLDVTATPFIADGQLKVRDGEGTRSPRQGPVSDLISAIKEAGVLQKDGVVVLDPGRASELKQVPPDLKQALIDAAKETGVRIAVQVGPTGNEQLFVANPDGTSQTQANGAAK